MDANTETLQKVPLRLTTWRAKRDPGQCLVCRKRPVGARQDGSGLMRVCSPCNEAAKERGKKWRAQRSGGSDAQLWQLTHRVLSVAGGRAALLDWIALDQLRGRVITTLSPAESHRLWILEARDWYRRSPASEQRALAARLSIADNTGKLEIDPEALAHLFSKRTGYPEP